MFNILRKTLQSYPFLMSRNFETQVYQWYGVKWIKSIFTDKGSSAIHIKYNSAIFNGAESNGLNLFSQTRGKALYIY